MKLLNTLLLRVLLHLLVFLTGIGVTAVEMKFPWTSGVLWRLLSKVIDTNLTLPVAGSSAVNVSAESQPTNSTAETATAFPFTTMQMTSPTTTHLAQAKHKRMKPECNKFRNSDLYSMLEEVGDYNQKFMAQTPEEAGERFSALQPLSHASDAPNHRLNSPLISRDKHTFQICDDNCQEIRRLLREALDAEYTENDPFAKNVSAADSIYTADDGAPEVQEGFRNETSLLEENACSLDKFIAVGECRRRGEEELWGYKKLCSACHGVYMLHARCFPRFFNAIACTRNDCSCIRDWWSGTAHGKCYERTLTFTVMRNIGTEDCEVWHYEHLSIPIVCECYLSTSSWLKS